MVDLLLDKIDFDKSYKTDFFFGRSQGILNGGEANLAGFFNLMF
jgi:hypothetical protein